MLSMRLFHAASLILVTSAQYGEQRDYGRCQCYNGGKCLGQGGTIFEEDALLLEKHEQCLCAAGWRGYVCQEDEDECR
jgi:hypothetical protein